MTRTSPWHIVRTLGACTIHVISTIPTLSLIFNAWRWLSFCICLLGMACTETLESLKCILKHMSFHSDSYPHPVLQPQSLSCKRNLLLVSNPISRFMLFCFTWKKHEVFLSGQLHAKINVILDAIQQWQLKLCLQ